MKLLQRLNKEKGVLFLPQALICAGIGAAVGLITMIACGNYCLYSFLLLPVHAPPAFLFFLLFILNTSLFFYAAGMAKFGCCSAALRNVVILDLISALFLLLFYISFIRMAAFVFAFIMLLFCAALLLFAFREAFGENLILSAAELLLFIYVLLMILLSAAAILLN